MGSLFVQRSRTKAALEEERKEKERAARWLEQYKKNLEKKKLLEAQRKIEAERQKLRQQHLKQLKEAKEQARQRKYQRSLTKQSTFTSAINSSSIGRHAERSDLTVVTDSRRSSFSLPFITVDRDGKPARGTRKRTQDAKLQTPAQKKNLKNKA